MSNELMNMNNELAEQFSEKKNAFVSFAPETKEEKTLLFNALNKPEYRISDLINQTIAIKNFIVETVVMTSEETGEVEEVPRIVIIDTEGHTYVAVSKGIFNALKNLIATFGMPGNWDEPLVVKVKQVAVKAGSMLTFELQ